MQNNISYLKRKTDAKQHQLFNNIFHAELKTFCINASATLTQHRLLNTSKNRLYKPFNSTSVPKLTSGY